MNGYPVSYPKVILVGDSLTELGNFGGLLHNYFIRRADVYNRGLQGYNTNHIIRHVLPQLTQDFLKDAACLTLCIGANDSWSKLIDNNYNPYLPVSKYKNNLMVIIKHLIKYMAKEKIIMITPPTIVEEDWLNYCRSNNELIMEKSPQQTLEYVTAMQEVGRDLGILVLDAFELTSRAENINRAFVDGLHFSDFGGTLIFHLIKDEIKKRVDNYRGTNEQNYPQYPNLYRYV